MDVFKIGFIEGKSEKSVLKMEEKIYRVNFVEQGGWRVLPIMYCLSTDTLADLYLYAVLKLPVRTHCYIRRE